MMSTSAEQGFESWHGDHTDLVHVLWDAKHNGLTLADDCDEIASRIMDSRWIAAVRHHAVSEARRVAAEGDITEEDVLAGAAVLRAMLGDLLGTDEEVQQMARGVLLAALSRKGGDSNIAPPPELAS